MAINCNAQARFSFKIPLQYIKEDKVNLIPFSQVYQTDQDLDVVSVDSLITLKKMPLAKQKASQGFSQYFFWVQFKLDWTNVNKNLLLEVNNPHIDKIGLYQKNGNQFTKIGFGGDRNLKFTDRSHTNRRYIFPFKNTGLSTTYYLMIDKRNASVSFPLWIYNQDVFETKEGKQNIYFGVFFGVIFFLGFIALFIGVFVSKKVFLYYAGYTLSMGLYLFTALGYSFQFLYPNSENLNNYSRVILSVIIAVFSTLFLRVFLNIDQNSPKISRIYKIISVVLIALSLSWLLFSNLYQVYTIWLLKVSNVLFLSIFIGAFYAAFLAYKTHRYNATVFFIAFSSMILGIVAYVGVEYGVINEDFFPINPILLGSGFEIIVLSVAMAYQLTKIINSKELLELQKRMLEEAAQSLEAQNMSLKKTTAALKEHIITSKKTEIEKPKTIVLKSKAVLQLDDIICISSDSHYLEFYLTTKNKPEVDRNTIKFLLDLLPKSNFVQVHRSHIININHLKTIKASELILIDDKVLPISRSFKPKVEELLLKS